MKIISENKVPIFSWCNDPEDEAIEQASNLANLPFVFKHIALMPDTHAGAGMPIGGILATNGVIVPNAVGVDIGCGMLAKKTNLKVSEIPLEKLKEIMGLIRKEIPVGVGNIRKGNEIKIVEDLMLPSSLNKIISSEYNNARASLGTLGSGNHFIEFQKDDEGYLWFMIHSGSRNLGHKVAVYYNDIANKMNRKYYSSVSEDKNLAFLPLNSAESNDYYHAMQYCVEYALRNRQAMERIISLILINNFSSIIMEQSINIAHNYARIENHFGENVVVHRKGATSAKEGEIGIIPGSQGSKSYIVRGKGNPKSFMSCSHGAGRKMSRTKAKKELNLAEEIKRMDDLGIIHGMRNVSDLDEAASAYKDIDIVMDEQKDLVDIITELTPIAVIKG